MNRLIVFSALMVLASCVAANADEGCKKLSGIAQVEMRTPGGTSPEIMVTVAGQQRPLIVDTGANITSFTPSAVTDLGLAANHTNAGVRDILGNISEEVAMVPSLQIGRLKTEDFKVFIFPDEFGTDYNAYLHAHGGFDGDLAGLFGADFLRSYDVDFDFASGKLRLFSSDHCPNQVVFWHPQSVAVVPMKIDSGGDIVITMTLDGQEIDAVVDTGADTSVLSAKAAKRLFNVTPDSSAQQETVINGRKVTGVFVHRFGSLSVEGLTISNPDIVIQPDFATESEGVEERWYANRFGYNNTPPLILGMPELRKLHLYVDYHDKTLFISPAADEVLPPALAGDGAGGTKPASP